jgi:hypothetical protein
LVAVRGQKLAAKREHHRHHVLRAGIGKDARGIRKRRAARAKSFQKLRRVVTRVTRRRDLDPFEPRLAQTIRRIGLTKGDVGGRQRGIGRPGREYRGAGRRRRDEAMGPRALVEELRHRGVKLAVGPDR